MTDGFEPGLDRRRINPDITSARHPDDRLEMPDVNRRPVPGSDVFNELDVPRQNACAHTHAQVQPRPRLRGPWLDLLHGHDLLHDVRDRTTENRGQTTRSAAPALRRELEVPTTTDRPAEDGACAICPLSSVVCPLNLVGLGRLERPTSRLSGVRSNQLSYRPRWIRRQHAATQHAKAARSRSWLPSALCLLLSDPEGMRGRRRVNRRRQSTDASRQTTRSASCPLPPARCL